MKKLLILLVINFVLLISNAQVTDIASGNFKVIDIGTNSYGSYSKSVILLHEIYNGTLLSKNYAVGDIYAFRGSASSNNRTNVAKVNTSSGYSHTYGSVISVDSDGKWTLKIVVYQGKKYLAVHVPYRADQHNHSFQFMGRSYSTGEAMKLIVYEDGGSTIDSEIASSMQNFNPNMAEYHDVSKFVVKSNMAVGASDRTDIGTLHVTSDNTSIQPVIRIESSTNSHNSFIRFQAKNSSATNKYADIVFDPNSENLIFKNPYTANRMIIKSNGNVGIGTLETGIHKLAVEGSIGAREVKVEASTWSDFVFNKDYNLKNLNEVELFIEENKHLPDIPSETEVIENGISLGEMDAKLLQKIEELTLYMIEMNKEIQLLKKENELLKEKINTE